MSNANSDDSAAREMMDKLGLPRPLPFGATKGWEGHVRSFQGWPVDGGKSYLVAYPGRALFCWFDPEGRQAGNWWPASHRQIVGLAARVEDPRPLPEWP